MFPAVVVCCSVESADYLESARSVAPIAGDAFVSEFCFGGHYCLLPSVEMSGFGLGHFQLGRRFEELPSFKAVCRKKSN